MLHPAGTLPQNDVALTLMRRNAVASTYVRRHFNVLCLLGTATAIYLRMMIQAHASTGSNHRASEEKLLATNVVISTEVLIQDHKRERGDRAGYYKSFIISFMAAEVVTSHSFFEKLVLNTAISRPYRISMKTYTSG